MSLHLITGYAGAEHIMSADQGSFNIAMFGDGQYVLDHGNNFEASLINDNTVRILDGDMIIQGRHVRLAAGTTEEVTITTGTQGMNRNDLIVARYTKNAGSGVETAEFVVIMGEESAGTASDPDYNEGDITDGTDLVNDFPLYRVSLSGLTATLSEPLFSIKGGLETITGDIADIMSGSKTVANATHATSADSATTATSATTAGSASNDFILRNNQTLTFTNNVCEISDARITANSLADVYFTNACIQTAIKANITVETTAGKVTLTASRTPEATLTASIKIRVV